MKTLDEYISKIKEKGCYYCGSFLNITIDHRHPKSLGGKFHKKNLQCLCRACNVMKASIPHKTLLHVFVYYEKRIRNKTKFGKKILKKMIP